MIRRRPKTDYGQPTAPAKIRAEARFTVSDPPFSRHVIGTCQRCQAKLNALALSAEPLTQAMRGRAGRHVRDKSKPTVIRSLAADCPKHGGILAPPRRAGSCGAAAGDMSWRDVAVGRNYSGDPRRRDTSAGRNAGRCRPDREPWSGRGAPPLRHRSVILFALAGSAYGTPAGPFTAESLSVPQASGDYHARWSLFPVGIGLDARSRWQCRYGKPIKRALFGRHPLPGQRGAHSALRVGRPRLRNVESFATQSFDPPQGHSSVIMLKHSRKLSAVAPIDLVLMAAAAAGRDDAGERQRPRVAFKRNIFDREIHSLTNSAHRIIYR